MSDVYSPPPGASDAASGLPLVNRLGLIFMALADLALVAYFVGEWLERPPGSRELHGAALYGAYAIGLTWGWWRIRPRGAERLTHTLVLSPLLAQACIYGVGWSLAALSRAEYSVQLDAASGLGFGALTLSFFVIGPLGGIGCAAASRRAAVLFIAEVGAPALFLLFLL